MTVCIDKLELYLWALRSLGAMELIPKFAMVIEKVQTVN